MPSHSTSVGKSSLKRIRALDARITELELQRKHMIAELQVQCKHPASEIVEVPYREGFLGSVTPPYRVCKLCGLAEEGWHCGYWKLDTQEELASVSDAKARKDYVLKFMFQEDMNKLRFKR